MTLRSVLALLVCSLFFTSCDLWHYGGDDEPDEPVLLPLDVGNQWVMAFSRFDAEGTLIESNTDTLRVVGDTTVAGERWAEIRGLSSLANSFLGGFYANRDDGVWRWRNPSSDGAPYLLYKYPAEVGDTYEHPAGLSEANVTVLSTEALIDTPAGSLIAYHYLLDFEEALDTPIPDDVGQFDRFLVPGQGFAFVECSFITLREEWETAMTFDWQLIAFEGN